MAANGFHFIELIQAYAEFSGLQINDVLVKTYNTCSSLKNKQTKVLNPASGLESMVTKTHGPRLDVFSNPYYNHPHVLFFLSKQPIYRMKNTFGLNQIGSKEKCSCEYSK